MTRSAPRPLKPGKVASGRFGEIYQQGHKAVGRQLILFYLPGDEALTYAVVASRKIGNAVKRNRAKRILREAFRSHVGEFGKRRGAYILLARAGIAGSSAPEVAGELEKLLTRLKRQSQE